jgi:hypothetical protein
VRFGKSTTDGLYRIRNGLLSTPSPGNMDGLVDSEGAGDGIVVVVGFIETDGAPDGAGLFVGETLGFALSDG